MRPQTLEFSSRDVASLHALTFLPTRGLTTTHAVGNFIEPGCVLLIRWLGGIETPRLNVTRGPHAPPRRRGGKILREIHLRTLLDISGRSSPLCDRNMMFMFPG